MELVDYRKQLDEIDREIAELFRKRLDISAKIGKYKRDNNIAALDLAREEEIMSGAESCCGHFGRELFAKILELSKNAQANGNNL